MNKSTASNDAIRKAAARGVFTTGQVAKICSVAPRTVSKWFDSGKLSGYRLPGSDDRRIPAHELKRFVLKYKISIALDLAVGVSVLLVSPDQDYSARICQILKARGLEVTIAEDLFLAGKCLSGRAWYAVVVDAAYGRKASINLTAGCVAETQKIWAWSPSRKRPRVLVLCPEDGTGLGDHPGCVVRQKPVPDQEIVALVEEAIGAEYLPPPPA
jgi:excisionase family DNA binding protein